MAILLAIRNWFLNRAQISRSGLVSRQGLSLDSTIRAHVSKLHTPCGVDSHQHNPPFTSPRNIEVLNHVDRKKAAPRLQLGGRSLDGVSATCPLATRYQTSLHKTAQLLGVPRCSFPRTPPCYMKISLATQVFILTCVLQVCSLQFRWTAPVHGEFMEPMTPYCLGQLTNI